MVAAECFAHNLAKVVGRAENRVGLVHVGANVGAMGIVELELCRELVFGVTDGHGRDRASRRRMVDDGRVGDKA